MMITASWGFSHGVIWGNGVLCFQHLFRLLRGFCLFGGNIGAPGFLLLAINGEVTLHQARRAGFSVLHLI